MSHPIGRSSGASHLTCDQFARKYKESASAAAASQAGTAQGRWDPHASSAAALKWQLESSASPNLAANQRGKLTERETVAAATTLSWQKKSPRVRPVWSGKCNASVMRPNQLCKNCVGAMMA